MDNSPCSSPAVDMHWDAEEEMEAAAVTSDETQEPQEEEEEAPAVVMVDPFEMQRKRKEALKAAQERGKQMGQQLRIAEVEATREQEQLKLQETEALIEHNRKVDEIEIRLMRECAGDDERDPPDAPLELSIAEAMKNKDYIVIVVDIRERTQIKGRDVLVVGPSRRQRYEDLLDFLELPAMKKDPIARKIMVIAKTDWMLLRLEDKGVTDLPDSNLKRHGHLAPLVIQTLRKSGLKNASLLAADILFIWPNGDLAYAPEHKTWPDLMGCVFGDRHHDFNSQLVRLYMLKTGKRLLPGMIDTEEVPGANMDEALISCPVSVVVSGFPPNISIDQSKGITTMQVTSDMPWHFTFNSPLAHWIFRQCCVLFNPLARYQKTGNTADLLSMAGKKKSRDLTPHEALIVMLTPLFGEETVKALTREYSSMNELITAGKNEGVGVYENIQRGKMRLKSIGQQLYALLGLASGIIKDIQDLGDHEDEDNASQPQQAALDLAKKPQKKTAKQTGGEKRPRSQEPEEYSAPIIKKVRKDLDKGKQKATVTVVNQQADDDDGFNIRIAAPPPKTFAPKLSVASGSGATKLQTFAAVARKAVPPRPETPKPSSPTRIEPTAEDDDSTTDEDNARSKTPPNFNSILDRAMPSDLESKFLRLQKDRRPTPAMAKAVAGINLTLRRKY